MPRKEFDSAWSLASAARPEATNRLTQRNRDLRGQRLAGQLRSLSIRLEEIHTIRTLRQVSTETDLFVGWQLALEIIQTKLNQLVAVNHGVPSLIALMRLADLPSFSMAAPGSSFRESSQSGGKKGTRSGNPGGSQPMRWHASERFAGGTTARPSREG